MMDDSAMYTGVDGEQDGQFGNEVVDENVQKKLDEQKALVKELTPQLEKLLETVEAERASALEAIAEFLSHSLAGKDVDLCEAKAAARYREYLANLKTKFALALRETKK